MPITSARITKKDIKDLAAPFKVPGIKARLAILEQMFVEHIKYHHNSVIFAKTRPTKSRKPK
jgi:hypothetical protein